MKKVLIIAYYWPPSGGGGVQRWLKFVKYLPQFGWEPIVYTPENPNAPVVDTSFEKDISKDLTLLKQPIREPYQMYRVFTGRKKSENPGAAFASEKKNPGLEKIAIWIRSNFFIPDARIFWVKPSVKYLSKYLQENPVDMIVSTGPPHSMHLIGLKLHQRTKIPWIADFRDPWIGIDYYDELLLSSWADKKHKRLEKQVLRESNHVITVSRANTEAFRQMGFQHVSSITNGFDPDDLSKTMVETDKSFSIAHIGTFMYNRNPETLWEVLSELASENEGFSNDLSIKLIGKVDQRITESIQQHQLGAYLDQRKYLAHDEAITELKKSQLLLLIINKTGNSMGMLTGKIFEYISSGRPVLCIGPRGCDAEKLLLETNTGRLSELDDKNDLKNNILSYYKLYKEGALIVNPKNLENYSRKNLTKQLSVIFDEVIDSKIK